MPWWVDLSAVLSLAIAAAILIWCGIPSRWREKMPDLRVHDLLETILSPLWDDIYPIEIEVRLTGRVAAIGLSLLLAIGIISLASSPAAYFTMKPALVGTAVFGTITAGLLLLLWKKHEGVVWRTEIQFNFWAGVVVVAAGIGLIILSL